MKISSVSNINFKQNSQLQNEPPKDEKKGLSTTAKTLIGAGVVAAGTLAVYFITRNNKAAKNAAEVLTEPKAAKTITETVEPEVLKEPKFLDDNIKEQYNKLDKKVKKYINDKIDEFKDLTLSVIKPYKKDLTRIEFANNADKENVLKEIILFDKNNEFDRQISSSFVLEKSLNQFPMEYVRTTKIKTADNKSKQSVMSYYLDMLPKKHEFTADNKTSTYIYGYDLNLQPSGFAYTKDDKVILKLDDKKYGQVFDNFEDLFNTVERDDFKMK